MKYTLENQRTHLSIQILDNAAVHNSSNVYIDRHATEVAVCLYSFAGVYVSTGCEQYIGINVTNHSNSFLQALHS
jgi:hypothetical protein